MMMIFICQYFTLLVCNHHVDKPMTR
uniref:Uncharacterized protein n=1 Tax=Arundo donax TaxID=35708 RepID=A0A0A8ZHU1_ARUDO